MLIRLGGPKLIDIANELIMSIKEVVVTLLHKTNFVMEQRSISPVKTVCGRNIARCAHNCGHGYAVYPY